MTPRQSRRTIVELLKRHDLRVRKAFGQHFLADPNLVDKIVSLAEVESEDSVLEIGAGTGALTIALAATGARVVAYEVDERFRPILSEVLAETKVEMRFADVMAVDWSAALDAGPWKMVSNLPYNIGTPLVLDILLGVPSIRMLIVMVQREVADRLLAAPGGPDYGVPSVVVGLTARVGERFAVPPQVFVPAPRVSSTVVRLDRVDPPDHLEAAVELARAAFGQRRKMLRRSLVEVVAPDSFDGLGIAPSARPEDLSPADFLALARSAADA